MTDVRFSVIITTFNRPAQLARCLASLARCEYPREKLEVIVVDDGGTVPLDEILEKSRKDMKVRLIEQPNGGPANGRNRGAAAARNDFLAFIDDDCEPSFGWLAVLGRRLEQSAECLVGGRCVNGLTENPYSTASQIIVEMVYEYYNADREHPRFFTTNNLAVRTDLFWLCNGFDESFRTSEDREFCNRWQHRGFPMVYAPEAVVEHRHVLTFATFWHQHLNYGRGAAQFQRICAARKSGRLRDHLGFHAMIPRWWRAAVENHNRADLAAVVPLLALWQIANAAGFFRELLLG